MFLVQPFLINGTFSSGFANIRSIPASSAALASNASDTSICVNFFYLLYLVNLLQYSSYIQVEDL